MAREAGGAAGEVPGEEGGDGEAVGGGGLGVLGLVGRREEGGLLGEEGRWWGRRGDRAWQEKLQVSGRRRVW